MQGLSVGFRETEKIRESSQRLFHPHDWLALGLGKFKLPGLEHGAPLHLSLSWCALSMCSLQHGGFGADLLATQPLEAPQAFVLSKRMRQKLCHLLRPSLESHIVRYFCCAVPEAHPRSPFNFKAAIS